MMMNFKRRVEYTNKFKKQYRKAKKQGKDIVLLESIIELLANDISLPQKYEDHPMKGKWKGCRECHIEPDWVLIYKKINDDELYLYLTRLGSHSDLGITGK
jgi:mRNA interferase YafQ